MDGNPEVPDELNEYMPEAGGKVEDASIDPHWSPADGPLWAPSSRKRSRKRRTKAEGEQEGERRKTHHTRAWYTRQLFAVANGEVVLTTQQYRALIAFGRVRGWNRRPPDKKPSRNRFLR